MGSYLQVRSGKWHLATNPRPTWAGEELSVCGRRFTPRNVTWNEPPPCLPRDICAACTSRSVQSTKENVR